MAKPEHSIVEYFSKNDGNSCGYCKSSNSSCSHGMWAHNLSVQQYQSLVDRGWRRSGHYCYKPVMNETCCPSYTIKCDATQFKLTRSQRKLLKRFNHYLMTGEKIKGSSKHQDRNELRDIHQPSQSHAPSNVSEKTEEGTSELQIVADLKNESQPSQSAEYPQTIYASSIQSQPSIPSKTVTSTKSTTKRNNVTIVPPNTSESTKAKHLRIERRKQTLLSRGLTLEEVNATMQASKLRRMTKERTLEDIINIALPENAKHRLEIRLVRSWPPSSHFKKTCYVEWQVYRRYQMSIHKDPSTKCTMEQFNRFLCSSPLQKHESEGVGYGSFHQQYWLDGRLIAVGVLDILPHCVSSVYFFYDPDYSWLSLGTVSSLREVEFTRSLQRRTPDLHSYYMGFYIHSCAKMRYKGNLRPSYLLCPEVYSWHDIKTARQILNQSKYSRLNPDPNAKDENCQVNLDQVQVLTLGKVMLYCQFKQMYDHDEEHPMIQEYAQLVGKYCAYNMLLVQ